MKTEAASLVAMALIKTGQDNESPLRIVETVVAVNDQRKRAMARKVANAFGGGFVTVGLDSATVLDGPQMPIFAFVAVIAMAILRKFLHLEDYLQLLGSSDNVVAKTARPISLVASLAASFASIRFSSIKRKMFSRTMIRAAPVSSTWVSRLARPPRRSCPRA